MQVDDILSFPFIDPPPQESLLRSLELLYSLGALDDDGKLNEVGKRRRTRDFPHWRLSNG